MIALRLTDGKPIWTDRVKGVIRGIAVDGRRMFVGTLGGTLYSYEPPRQRRRPIPIRIRPPSVDNSLEE